MIKVEHDTAQCENRNRTFRLLGRSTARLLFLSSRIFNQLGMTILKGLATLVREGGRNEH
jgi:hypothetical protein